MDRADKNVINLLNFILIFVENLFQNDAIHDYSVCQGTGSNPADNYKFQSHTGKLIIVVLPKF